ncbi:MAG: hypothetical protein ABSF52_15535 [Syntrophobacteraceae bacterium]
MGDQENTGTESIFHIQTIGGFTETVPSNVAYSAKRCKAALISSDAPGFFLINRRAERTKELEGSSGRFMKVFPTWKYPDCGIVLKMSSERKGGAKVVESIGVSAPSTLVTTGGIHIGSAEREVINAYGRYRDPEEPAKKGKQFVAGSIYDGMIFDLQDGRVVRIFLGAAAE